MNILSNRWISMLKPTLFTALMLCTWQESFGAQVVKQGDIQFAASLSQTKIVQGDAGTFYVEINVSPPEARSLNLVRSPVDMVVVLDRSGSMSEENRLPFAKSAIRELVDRLNSEDRFALVTFETNAQILSGLSNVSSEQRKQIKLIVNSISPAGSTNLSAGLELARGLLTGTNSGRTKKIILMSDGEANLGVVEPHKLNQIARDIGKTETVISTIGMGLGFNEVLMSSLADNGMGNYSYLEHLAALGEILQRDLQSSRSIYATSSGLEIEIPTGVSLVDSSGYPQEPGNTPSKTRILTGQLISGARKTFFLTFNVNTENQRNYNLGNMSFSYTASGIPYTVDIRSEQLALTIVEPSKKAEAVASVDKDIMRRSWSLNNIGRLQKQVGAELRQGNTIKAKETLKTFEIEMKKAETESNLPLADAKLSETIRQMSTEIDAASTGSVSEQAYKQNRAAKALQKNSLDAQRSSK